MLSNARSKIRLWSRQVLAHMAQEKAAWRFVINEAGARQGGVPQENVVSAAKTTSDYLERTEETEVREKGHSRSVCNNLALEARAGAELIRPCSPVFIQVALSLQQNPILHTDPLKQFWLFFSPLFLLSMANLSPTEGWKGHNSPHPS